MFAAVRPVTVKGVNLSACPSVSDVGAAVRPDLAPDLRRTSGLCRVSSGPISGSCATVRPVPSTFAACSPPVAFAPVRHVARPDVRPRPVPLAVRPVRCRMSAQPSASDLAAVRPVTVKGVNLSACRAVLPDVRQPCARSRSRPACPGFPISSTGRTSGPTCAASCAACRASCAPDVGAAVRVRSRSRPACHL